MNRILLLLLLVSLNLAAFTQSSPAPIKLVDVLLTPSHADWNYKTGEKQMLRCCASSLRSCSGCGNQLRVWPEMMEAEKKGRLSLKDGTGKISIGTSRIPLDFRDPDSGWTQKTRTRPTPSELF